ncbi:MAG: hypothetical protein PHQ28_02940 [Mycobacterium sp.]|nr:hypothetical protein [Mycobacterium sp.]
MTATVPGYLAWPLLAFMAAVVIARYVFFNINQYETYLNNTLAFLLVSNLLRERAIEDFLARHHVMTITTAQELSFVFMILPAAEFMGFITLWSQLSPTETRRRQRYHRLAAIALSVAYFVTASRARAAGQTLEVSRGWDIVLAWSFYLFLLVVLAAQLLRMGVKELIRPDAKRQERLVAIVGVVLSVAIGGTSLNAWFLAIFEQLGWLHSSQFRLTVHGFSFFFESVGVSVLAAVPALLALRARVGLDAISRGWHQLRGLRDSMTAAVPEVTFDLGPPNNRRQKTALELHQTTVQIRDAILMLRPYFPHLTNAQATQFFHQYSIPTDHHDEALQALQLAEAIRAKDAGATPEPMDAAVIRRSRSTNLEEETAELIRLAKWWPAAQAAARNAWLYNQVSNP